MNMKQTDPNSTQLRQEAEAQLAYAPDTKQMPRPAEKLLHELRVHQIELEMQNEQLRGSEVELGISRDRYVDFYDFAPVGYLTLNHEGMIDEINLTGAALLKVERNKLPHHRFAPFVAMEDRDRWHRHFLSVLKHDNSLSCELALQRGDGSRFYAQLDCLRLKKEGNEPVVRIVLTDITERKRIEEALRISALKHQLLFESSRDALLLAAPPSWKFTGANQATLQLFRSSSVAELTALGPWDVSPERQPDGRHSSEKAQEVIATAMRGGSHFFEWKFQRLDGQLFDADVLLTRMEVDEEVFLQGTIRDITERKQAEAELRIAATAFESQDGIMVTDAHNVILQVNRAFTEITGYTAEDAVGQTPHLLSSDHHDAAFYAAMWKSVQSTGAWQGEIWNRRKNGDVFPERLTITAVKGDAGEVTHYVAIMHDITERKQREMESQKLLAIVDSTDDAIISKTLDGIIQSWNYGAEQIFGYKSAEVIGKQMLILIPPDKLDEEPEILSRISRGEKVDHFETVRQRKDGRLINISATMSPIFDSHGRVVGISKIARDITERKQAEELIRALAFYDTLTQLPNRRLLNDRLEQTMAASKRSGRYAALMFLDLDNFKPLNDTHGHDVGDLLLMEAAQRLTHCVREMDTVARFGGDEFMVMLGELAVDKAESATQAGIVAEKIRATLAEPYVLKLKHEVQAKTTVEHRCTTSIGVVLFINHQAGTEEIIKWADMAMYQAKQAGGNLIRFYEAAGE